MSQEVLVEQDGRILRITFNRPDGGNGVSDDMAREVAGLLRRAAETSDFVILRGAGKDFCTGRFTPGAATRPPQPVEAYEARRRFDVVFDLYAAFRECPIPIVGVVQGRAHGLGCALAALCDITVAADTATFCAPEMRHNILPTMVMSALADRVPYKALSYLIYTTAEIPAERALTFGIVSSVAAAAELEREVDFVTAALLKEPRPALIGVKEYVGPALKMGVDGAIAYARSLHAMVNSSSEMRRS